jgi:uncharacterized protein YeaO (DUF488 family)
MIALKRIYDDAKVEDGVRILVDRLWPRGITKERAHVDEWMRDIAPSDELRRWFHHDPEKWSEFRDKYREELRAKQQLVEKLRRRARGARLTFLYSSKDHERNNAVALKEYLENGDDGR